jgi:NCS1 family nucleobase:cation symporter-1
MICDYYLVRRKILSVDGLYLRGSEYEYSGGFNWRAIASLIFGAAAALIGLVIPSIRFLYDYSWFVGFAVAFVTYFASMRNAGAEAQRL